MINSPNPEKDDDVEGKILYLEGLQLPLGLVEVSFKFNVVFRQENVVNRSGVVRILVFLTLLSPEKSLTRIIILAEFHSFFKK